MTATRRRASIVRHHPTYTEVLKLAGRSELRRGDVVKVRGSGTGKHDGFTATFAFAFEDAGGLVVSVLRTSGIGGYRFVKPERIVRKRRQPTDR